MNRFITVSMGFLAISLSATTLYAKTDVKEESKSSVLPESTIEIEAYQDKQADSVFGLHAASYLFDNTKASSINYDGGEYLSKLNMTYGMNIGAKQRFKLSGENVRDDKEYSADNLCHPSHSHRTT